MQYEKNPIGLIIPTFNAGDNLDALLTEISSQTLPISCRLIIDSSSDDNTIAIAKAHGCKVVQIPQQSFGHGKTRQQAFKLLADSVDYLIYLTQDVRLTDDNSLANLLAPMQADETVGACYGRQLPNEDASFEARILREFNYPPESRVTAYKDRKKYGLKTAFFSDSFAAYRKTSLESIGGFPVDLQICEDMYAGAMLLKAGYKIAYTAEAKAYHSHNFTLQQHWQRYRKMGRFQRQNQALLKEFGKSEGEGKKLLQIMLKQGYKEGGLAQCLKIIFSSAVKYAAFASGRYI